MSSKEMEADSAPVAAPAVAPMPEIHSEAEESTDPMKKTIETMTYEEKVAEINKFSIYDYLEEGMWIDAKDSVNAWCMASVVQVSDKHVRVHFDGWAA